MLKRREFRTAGISKSFRFHTDKINQRNSARDLGPAAKIKEIENPTASRRRLSSALEAGASVYFLEAPRKALRVLASDIRRYFAFCEPNDTPTCPIRGKHALRRIDLFNETATSQQYVNSLRKLCYLLRKSLDGDNKAVFHAAYGVRRAGNNLIRFPNFTRSEIVWRIVRRFGNEDELARLPYLSFLCAL